MNGEFEIPLSCQVAKHPAALQASAGSLLNRRSGILALAFLAMTLDFGGTGCGRRREATAGDNTAETVMVSRRQFASSVSAVGAVKPQLGAEVKVGSRVSGRVMRLYANLKDQVRKGQVIAELEKADLEATVAQYRAEVQLAEAKRSALDELLPKETAKAETDMARWEASVTLARKDLERQRDMLKDDVTSPKAEDQAQERLAVAQAQFEAVHKALEVLRTQYAENHKQAQAEFDRARAVLANAEVQLSYAVITAPISGVIGSVSTQEGETVAAGLNAPTFVTVIDLSRLQVEAYVDEVDIGKIKIAQQAAFTVDAFPAEDFEGKVVAIYPKASIQDNVVKYVVALEIVSPYEGRLRPEMTASVSIQLEARNVLAIPAKAVRREGGKHTVYVSANGHPAPREVRLGWKDGPWTEVASGLEEGEEVFLDVPQTESGGAK
jgi:multidrug efflux pump subunit AcrA (membrane-fusion protein)